MRASDAWAISPAELTIYAQGLQAKGLIWDYAANGRFILSLDGWAEVERLQKERTRTGNLAFIAMPFGNERLNSLVANHFVPAVRSAGFELRRLDQGQPAGLIDDQLRVRIRTARFVVSDLTDRNNGAYWEAGFAEGLGTPVIYSCERSVFESDQKSERPHFDTNHLVTVLWEAQAPEAAAKQLKAIIRATLPADATMRDD